MRQVKQGLATLYQVAAFYWAQSDAELTARRRHLGDVNLISYGDTRSRDSPEGPSFQLLWMTSAPAADCSVRRPSRSVLVPRAGAPCLPINHLSTHAFVCHSITFDLLTYTTHVSQLAKSLRAFETKQHRFADVEIAGHGHRSGTRAVNKVSQRELDIKGQGCSHPSGARAPDLTTRHCAPALLALKRPAHRSTRLMDMLANVDRAAHAQTY